MNARRRTLPLMLLLTLTLCLLGAATPQPPEDPEKPEKPEEPKKAKLDEKAPEFELKDCKGQTHKLSDYKDKIIILEWTSPQCPYVQRLYTTRDMQRAYEQLKKLDKKIVWLAINSNQRATARGHEHWIKRHEIKYPILIDAKGEVGKLYDARRTPHMFVIDSKGILKYHGAIDDNRLGVKTADELVNYVVQAVKQIRDEETVRPNYVKPYGCSIKYLPEGQLPPDAIE
jgi:peroxiredoxin